MAFSQPHQSRPKGHELGKLVVGPPGLQAHVPIRSTAPRWLTRLWRRYPLSETLVVTHGRAHIHVPEDDEGTVHCYLQLHNARFSEVTIRQLYVEQLLIAGSVTNVGAPMFNPPREPLQPHRGCDLYVRFVLQSAGIRQLIRAIRPAQNSRSSPGLELGITGSIEVVIKKRYERVSFQMRNLISDLNVSAPSAAVAD